MGRPEVVVTDSVAGVRAVLPAGYGSRFDCDEGGSMSVRQQAGRCPTTTSSSLMPPPH